MQVIYNFMIAQLVSTPEYIIGTTEEIIYVNTEANAISLTLPNPNLYRKIKIKDINGNLAVNNLTLVRFAVEKIENVAASKVFSTNYIGFEIQSDGTDWWLI